jgi:hypothetical protein
MGTETFDPEYPESWQEVAVRFAHHPPTSNAVAAAHEAARLKCVTLAAFVFNTIPPGDERERAIDAIDDACMAINAAIARTQLTRSPVEVPGVPPPAGR